MKTNACVLAGLALAAMAAPVWAGRSTRAEREATRQLNLEAARQALTSNQTLTPEIAVSDPSAKLPPDSPPVAAPTTRVEHNPIATPAGPGP